MGCYKLNGGINTTTVVGNVRTGLYAADGSLNIVLDDAVYKGVYHPCGALRVNSGTSQRAHDASGAYYSNHIHGHQK